LCALYAAAEMSFADSVTLHPVADTGLSAQSPAANFGTGADMVIGTQGPRAGTTKNRGLIKFDLSGQIPPSSEIKSVALTLTVARAPTSEPNSERADSMFELHRVLRLWNESQATWNIRAGTTQFWSSPGAAAPSDFSSTISATTFISGPGSYAFGSTTNLIADVQAWVDSPGTNFGWIVLTQSEEVAKTARRITSREGGENAPALVIEYTIAQTPPPHLSQMSVLGNTVTFQFDAQPQQSYAVEFNNDIGSTNWLTLTNIAAQPAPANITVSDSVTASHRCYRVKTP
jgi:hypothetical protein